MEVVSAILASLSAGVAAHLAMGGAAAPAQGSLARRALGWGLAAARLLRRAGATPLADALLSLGPCRDAARRLVELLGRAGVELDERAGSVAVGCGIVAACCVAGLLMASPVAAVATGAIVVGVALARESARVRRARSEVSASMPGVYRTLSVALASGQTLAQAVSYVGARERGPVGEAFARMSLRLRCGASTEDAVSLLARELGAPGAGLLATALVISHRTGSPLRDLLMRSAALAERQGELERTLGVKTAQVRLSVRIVCLLPAVMIALLALISPDFQAGLLTPAGIGCVLAAATLDVVALVIIRRLLTGVTRWT